MDREKEIIRLFPAKLKGALQSACLDYDNIRRSGCGPTGRCKSSGAATCIIFPAAEI